MGDIRVSSRSASKDGKVVSIDPYALVEALVGQNVDRPTSSGPDTLRTGYDDLDINLESRPSRGGNLQPDSPPKDVWVGAANPYAIVEALIGRHIDEYSMISSKIMANILQTDYDELFDMKHGSLLFAGLKLNEKEGKAEKLTEKDMRILNEEDLMTPDLSEVHRLEDLEKVGLKKMGKARVKVSRVQNGKVHLVLHAHSMAKRVSNREVTMSINELVSPFRIQKGPWAPPNCTWRDMYDHFFESVNSRLISHLSKVEVGVAKKTTRNFDDPTQGCTSNSWLIAALFSVFWSDPSAINRATRVYQNKDQDKRLAVKFHDKGGANNARTETVEVNYEIPINNSNNGLLYCRSSDGADIWPSLYEKAFAKWITGNSSDHPDITQTHSGDPVKAMAQINGREPQYYMTKNHSAYDMLGLVRSNCLNFKTISPMTAWTYATGNVYKGSNVVANHAYSVLGYAILGDKQYIVLRNPWGVTEPIELNSYPGLLASLDPSVWHPATLLDHGGVFAMDAQCFKDCFAFVGITKDGSKAQLGET